MRTRREIECTNPAEDAVEVEVTTSDYDFENIILLTTMAKKFWNSNILLPSKRVLKGQNGHRF